MVFTIGIAGRFREEEDPWFKDEKPDEIDAHGYAPGARVGSLFGAKVDGVCGEDSRRDEKLVGAHEGSS